MKFWEIILFILTVAWTGIVISTGFGTSCFNPLYSYITIILLYVQFYVSWRRI